MKADSIRATLGREKGRKEGSAFCREERDGQVQEKEMSQTPWWMGKEPQRGRRGVDPRTGDSGAGWPAHIKLLEELHPI